MASLAGVTSNPSYTAVDRKEIPISNINAMTVARTFKEHADGVTGLGILDQNRFISGSYDKSIKVWQKSSENSLKTCDVDDKNSIWHMQVLNQACLAIGWAAQDLSNPAIKIYNFMNDQSHDLLGHQNFVYSLAVSQQGLLASGSEDGSVKIWEPFSSKNLHTYYYYPQLIVFCVDFSPDGKTVVCGAQLRDQIYQIQMWEITSAKPDNRPPDKFFQTTCQVCAILVMKDGRIVSGSVDGWVRVWDPSKSPDKALIREMGGHYGNVTSLAERPDHLIVSGSSDKTIMLCNVDTGDSWRSPEEHTNGIQAVAAFDDNSILTASLDKTVKLWV